MSQHLLSAVTHGPKHSAQSAQNIADLLLDLKGTSSNLNEDCLALCVCVCVGVLGQVMGSTWDSGFELKGIGRGFYLVPAPALSSCCTFLPWRGPFRRIP